MKHSNQPTEPQLRVIEEIAKTAYVFFSLKIAREYLRVFGLELLPVPLIRLGDGTCVVRSDVVAKMIAEHLRKEKSFGFDVSDEEIILGKPGSRQRVRECTLRILRAVVK